MQTEQKDKGSGRQDRSVRDSERKSNLRGMPENQETEARDDFALGLGNLISSITITLFYLIFFSVMNRMHPGAVPDSAMTAIRRLLLILAVIRILLCLFPGNAWFRREGNPRWGIIRNIPFVLIGIITIYYLIVFCGRPGMAALILVSFLCYMAVVLLVRKKPMMGMLMIPKTICYIWIIAILL